jgi:hypothetical protein
MNCILAMETPPHITHSHEGPKAEAEFVNERDGPGAEEGPDWGHGLTGLVRIGMGTWAGRFAVGAEGSERVENIEDGEEGEEKYLAISRLVQHTVELLQGAVLVLWRYTPCGVVGSLI